MPCLALPTIESGTSGLQPWNKILASDLATLMIGVIELPIFTLNPLINFAIRNCFIVPTVDIVLNCRAECVRNNIHWRTIFL